MNQHPIAQLIRWGAQGNDIKTRDLDEADVPQAVRGAVKSAAQVAQEIYSTGAQAEALDTADEYAADIIRRMPDREPRRPVYPDDPRDLAKLINRN